jgi:hypothetical protein
MEKGMFTVRSYANLFGLALSRRVGTEALGKPRPHSSILVWQVVKQKDSIS